MDAQYKIGNEAFQVKRTGVISLASGNVTIAAAAAGKKIRVLSLMFSITTGAVVSVQSGAGGTALLPSIPATVTGLVILNPHDGGWCEAAENTLLNVNSGAAIVGTVQCVYAEVTPAKD